MSPLYEYRCVKCDYEDEKIEPFSASSIQDCPVCKYKASFIRKIGAPKIIFKGGCWYKDSYSK